MNTTTARPGTTPAGGSLRDLLEPLVDYRPYIIVFVLSAVVSALVLTYVYSEKYLAATSISFRPQEVTRLRQKETLAFGAPLPTPPFDLIYDNLQLLVQSEPILFQVIEELGLDAEEEVVYTGPWYIQSFKRTKDWVKQMRDDTWVFLKYGRLLSDEPATGALKGLRSRLNLINHNSYIFSLSYIDKDPVRAAMVVDRIAEHVVEALLEGQQQPGILRREQLQSLRDAKAAEIEHYQGEIELLLSSNGIVSVALETERALERHAELELEQVRLSSQIAHTRARLEGLERRGAGDPVRAAGLQPEDYRRLKSEKLFTEIEFDALQEQHKSLLAMMARLERRMTQFPALQHEHDSLIHALGTAQRDFVQISDPYHEAEVQATEVMSEAVIEHKARVPSLPVTPIKIYHVGLAAGLSLSLAFGVAYLLAFALSDHVSEMVTRTVGNVVSMWDGEDRRERRDRRRANPPPYSGPERRRGSRRLDNPEERQ